MKHFSRTKFIAWDKARYDLEFRIGSLEQVMHFDENADLRARAERANMVERLIELGQWLYVSATYERMGCYVAESGA